MTIQAQLKAMMEEIGLTAAQMASRLDYSQGYVYDVLSGRKPMTDKFSKAWIAEVKGEWEARRAYKARMEEHLGAWEERRAKQVGDTPNARDGER